MAAHTIGGEARWVQSATLAHLGRRPSRPVDRAKVLGGAAVDCSSRRKKEHDGGALWMQGVAHGSEPLGTGAGASGQGLPNLRYTNGTHLPEPAVREGTVLDVTSVGGTKTRQPVQMGGQAKYYSSKLIQPGLDRQHNTPAPAPEFRIHRITVYMPPKATGKGGKG